MRHVSDQLGGHRLVALSLFVLLASHIGGRLSFGSRSVGAIVTALGFAVWSSGLGDAVHNAVAMVGGGATERGGWSTSPA